MRTLTILGVLFVGHIALANGARATRCSAANGSVVIKTEGMLAFSPESSAATVEIYSTFVGWGFPLRTSAVHVAGNKYLLTLIGFNTELQKIGGPVGSGSPDITLKATCVQQSSD